MLEAKTIQKYKKRSLSWLINKAQSVVNAYVRKRDAKGEVFTCISCGKTKPITQMNAGHYFNRGNYASVRFDVDNIHGQCIQCNLYKHGNLIYYRDNLIKKIGQEKFNELELLAHLKNFKFDRFYLIDIIELYKNKKP